MFRKSSLPMIYTHYNCLRPSEVAPTRGIKKYPYVHPVDKDNNMDIYEDTGIVATD
jgi:hypothetical protein